MKKNYKYIFILGLGAAAVIVFTEAQALSERNLKFYLLDVGQGDAILTMDTQS